MDLADLEFGLKSVSSAGFGLNAQELISIQAGLAALKSAEKYETVFFWGKIFGQSSDYYLVYGVRDSDFEFPSKNFFYAVEDFEFKELVDVTEDVAEKILEVAATRPFVGNPQAPLVQAAGGEEGAEPADDSGLTEVHHLAQVVREIDFDTAAVPKGAYALSEKQIIVPSTAFRGLGFSEAAQLKSYEHFRPPASIASLRTLARDDAQFLVNFLDPLSEDLPMGCWALRQEPSIGLVSLRSLSWPGYVAYHIPSSARFGGAYFGYGQKSRDLAFVL